MIERPEIELKFVKSQQPLASVEVDLDSIPDNLSGYGSLMMNALKPFAERFPDVINTIYVYTGPSVNFHTQTYSVFFCVAGKNEVLNQIFNAFKGVPEVNVRRSDYVDPKKCNKDYHLQDGHVWRKLEPGTWYADTPDETDSTEEIHSEGKVSRDSTAARIRAARSDASVGSIRKDIEEVYGLPEGSVVLCGPDKNALRSDATIATLRKRWE